MNTQQPTNNYASRNHKIGNFKYHYDQNGLLVWNYES